MSEKFKANGYQLKNGGVEYQYQNIGVKFQDFIIQGQMVKDWIGQLLQKGSLPISVTA
jgi:hypothetical protein